MTKSIKKFLLIFLALICTVCVALFCASCDGCDDDPDETDGEQDINVASDLASSFSDGCTLTIKDVSITVPVDTSAETISAYNTNDTLFDPDYVNVQGDVSYATSTFNAGEMYVSLAQSDNSYTINAYAKGEITSTAAYTYSTVVTKVSAELYCDGGTAYIIYETTESDDTENADTGEKMYIKVDINNILDLSGVTSESLSALDSLASTSENAEAMYALANGVFEELFTKAETADGGYTLTLDTTAISTLLDDCYTLSVANLIDKYIGSGTYSEIESYIDALGDKTVATALSDLTTYCTNFGLDTDTVYECINMVLSDICNVDVDFSPILSGNSSSAVAQTTEISQMTVSAFFTKYIGTTYSYVASQIKSACSQTVFNLMFNSSSYATSVYNTISDYISSAKDSLSLVLTENADGSASIELKVTNYSVVTDSNYGSTLTVSGTVSVQSGATLPSTASTAVTNFNNGYASLASVLNNTCTSGKYSFANGTSLTVSGSTITYTSGSYTLSSSSAVEVYAKENIYSSSTSYNYTIISIVNNETLEVSINVNAYTDSDTNETTYSNPYCYYYRYDANGNTLENSYVSSSGYYYTYTYTRDANGNRLTYNYSNSYGDSESCTYTYDSDGNMLTQTRVYTSGAKDVYTYTYDSNGNETSYSYKYYYSDGTAGESYSYTYTYDSHNNMTSRSYVYYSSDGTLLDSYSDTYEYTYDSNGNVTKRVSTSGNYTYTYTYEYYTSGIKSKETYEEKYYDYVQYIRTYEYDANGNNIKYSYTSYSYTSYSNGSTYTYSLNYYTTRIYEYNTDGNTTSESYTKYENDVATSYYSYTYTYDTNGYKTKEAYSSSSGSSYTYTYTYNSSGNITEQKYTSSIGDSYTCTYTYNSDDKVTSKVLSLTYSDGSYYTESYMYTYSNGSLTEYKATYSDSDNATATYVFTFSNGKLVNETYSDSNSFTYTHTCTYGSDGLLLTETYTDSDGASDSYSYEYEILYNYGSSIEVYVTVTSADGFTYTYSSWIS